MGRQFPRFLLCSSINAKSKGVFIIHSLEPRFICKPVFNKGRLLGDCDVLDIWTEGVHKYSIEVSNVIDDLRKWWRYSGIHESSNPKDQIISKLSKLDFLRDADNHFTLEEAQEVVKIIFATKAKNINTSRSSYGLKHDFERLSRMFLSGSRSKYCSNDILKDAMKKEGFNSKLDSPNSPNEFYNISEKELNMIDDIATFIANNYYHKEDNLY